MDLELHLVLQKYDVLLYVLDSWYMPCMFCTCETVVTTFWLKCFDIWHLTVSSDSSFLPQKWTPPWGYLQEGMLFNHFQKNRELTTKVGLTNNLRRRKTRGFGRVLRLEVFHRWMRWLVRCLRHLTLGFSARNMCFFWVWSKQDSSTDVHKKSQPSKIIPYRWAEAAHFTNVCLKTNITTLQIDGLEDGVHFFFKRSPFSSGKKS